MKFNLRSLGDALRKAMRRGRGARRGYLERIGPHDVSGWHAWAGDAPPVLQLVCGSERFEVDADWHERPDVHAQVQNAPLRSGFSFALPPGAVSLLGISPSAAQSLHVLAAGEPIRPVGAHAFHLPSMASQDGPGFGENLSILDSTRRKLAARQACRADGIDIKVGLALAGGFRVIATVAGDPQRRVDIQLAHGEQRLQAQPPDRAVRRDERVFELPGRWWEDADARGIEVQIAVGGRLLPARPVTITTGWALECLSRTARRGARGTYEQLLALEHAHFLAPRVPLPAALQAWLQAVAKQYGLVGYLPLDASAVPVPDDEEVARYRVSAAMRELNRRLPTAPGEECRLAEDIARELPEERQREWLRESLLPWLYRRGRLADARRLLTPAHERRLCKAGSAWTASLALPLLVSGGELERATAIVRQLHTRQGWVAAECLAEASRQALAHAGRTPAVERFGLAMLEFIERWSWDYWARAEDVELIDACVAWVAASARFSTRFRADLAERVMRAYGLSPRFWERVAPVLRDDDPLHRQFAAAGDRFRRLAQATRQVGAGQPFPPTLRADLAWFRRAGSHNAARFLREIACAHAIANDAVPASDDDAITDVLALAEGETVRIAALPVAQAELPAVDATALTSRLLAMQWKIPRAPHALLQSRLRRQLDVPGFDIAAFIADAEALGGDTTGWLSIDLLATAWCRARTADDAARLSAALERQLALAAPATTAAVPPQPLLAALARLGASGRLASAPALQAAVSRLVDAFSARQDGVSSALVAPEADASVEADVLVVLYSCRKYLDDRVQAIRDTWMRDLQARGIRCLVMVGDGDDTLEGDVLRLAVGDRYEDLPAKTLAMVRWVLANTRAQYLVKIDDDCFLNTPAYFDDLVYRTFHYYGRVLRREKGGMDRRWHQGRSQGRAAQAALDKSPEPSVYADGGGGYCLSRYAMARMLAAAETPVGARLVATSFMEDKLAGDLLALSGIVGRNDEYFTLVRRRHGSNAEPVCVFENTFLPCAEYPAKLAHLDTHRTMAPTWAARDAHGLWPRKLWPSYWSPTLDYGASNQLELLTPTNVASQRLAEGPFVVAAMRNEMTMLPHFLAHYRRLGVRAFLVVDNLSDDGTREYLLAQPDVVLYSADTEYRNSTFGVAWQQTLIASHCLNRWALVADADELLVCPGGVDLPTYIAALEAGGHDAARVFMIDMYPAGDLGEADFDREDPFRAAPFFDREAVVPWRLGSGAYNNAGNYVSGLRHRLIPTAEPNAFTAQKYCLVRYAPWMRFCAGLHNVANARVAPQGAWFAHFKYHAGFKARVAAEVARKQHFGDAREYRKYQELLAEGQGGFAAGEHAQRYEGPADFARIVVGDDA